MNKNTEKVKRNRAKKLAVVQNIKRNPCTDCGGFFHPEAMEFDHVGNDKVGDISRMLTFSLERIMLEIAKCELVCANCHRVRTFNRRTRVFQR